MVFLAPWLIGALAAMPAEARPVAVRVECGMPSCPSVQDVRRRLGEVLGYDPIVEGAARRVMVRFAAAGDGVATELRLFEGQGAAGARRFETAVPDWDAVLAATAMNIALIVDPGRLDLLAPPSPTPPPPAPTPPEPEPMPEPDPLTIEVAMGGGVAYGLTPGATAQVEIGAGLWGDLIGGEMGLRYTFPSAEAFAGGEVVADLVAGDIGGCLRWGPAIGCATALAGGQRATSRGLPGAREAWIPMVAVGARGAVEWAFVPDMRLRAGLDVRAPLTRSRLRVDSRLAWQSASVGVDGLLTVRYGF